MEKKWSCQNMELLHNPSLMQVGRCRLVHTLYFTFVCVCLWQSLSLEAAILSSPCPLAGDPCLACHFSVWQLRVRQQSNRGRRGEEEEGHDLYLGNVETNGRNWLRWIHTEDLDITKFPLPFPYSPLSGPGVLVLWGHDWKERKAYPHVHLTSLHLHLQGW